MSEHSLLAFCYCFPPMALAEAPLAAKQLGNLPGWRTDVIAATPWQGLPLDSDLLAYAEAGVRSVTRVALPAYIPAQRLKFFSRIPDPLRFMTGRAVEAAERLGLSRFDAMLSWSNWCSSHLAALRAKRSRPKLPWAVHFSDPWVDNPFVTMGGVQRALNGVLERAVIKAADRVLFTTPETVELVMAKYPPAWRAKVSVIPHGYDPHLFSGDRPAPRDGRKLVARYVGNFYGARSSSLLFRALVCALKRRPSLCDEVTIEIVGQSQVDPASEFDLGALPDGLVSFRSPVSYRESLRLMGTADLLMVVDAPSEQSVFLPSKLVDYLGAGRPIIALTPSGASARVLSGMGCPVADPANPEASGAAFLAGVDLAQSGWTPARQSSEQYSARHTAAELAAVLDMLRNSTANSAK